jgi:hypothetical protein
MKPFSPRKNLFTLTFLAASLFFAANSETFRVHKTEVIRLENESDRKSVESGVNDVIVVELPQDRTLIEGVEISIKVPKIVAEWRDSVAWSIYTDVSPLPGEKTTDYSGEKREIGTFGESLSANIKIPLVKNHSIKDDAFSTLTQIISADDVNFVFFRLQLAMKGVSNSITKAKFDVSARPILSDKGFISLKPVSPDGDLKEITVFVDGKQTDLDKKNALVATGKHDVSIVSNFYRNELRTVTVEQGKIAELEVLLRDIKPIIRLIAPEKTRIIFDDQEFTAPVKQFYTTQGNHSVKFIVGDYEIVKSVSTVDGRSYNISVNLDASVVETD